MHRDSRESVGRKTTVQTPKLDSSSAAFWRCLGALSGWRSVKGLGSVRLMLGGVRGWRILVLHVLISGVAAVAPTLVRLANDCSVLYWIPATGTTLEYGPYVNGPWSSPLDVALGRALVNSTTAFVRLDGGVAPLAELSAAGLADPHLSMSMSTTDCAIEATLQEAIAAVSPAAAAFCAALAALSSTAFAFATF